nr:hypothetical protein [Micromonospora sp. DSM 115978]
MVETQGRWVYQESGERQVFALCRVVEAGTADEWYDQLGRVQVTPDRRAPERLAEQLQPWAVATLRAGGHAFGRYYALLGILDEDDEPSRPIRQEYIDWYGADRPGPAR